MRGKVNFSAKAMLCACAGGLLMAAVPASALGSYSPYNETATAALARYVRELASNPEDFSTLIHAGRAALAVGDSAAAAGFFARADEVDPKSPLPHAGMGAVAAANGEPNAALPYFQRAQQLGGSVVQFGADRGLAYDLLGRQTEAQADYRAALAGPDADSARARLALSLAISGKRAEALGILGPLQAKGDPAGARARAFVLALTGDANGARVAIDAAMPGSAPSIAPFLARLPGLNSGQQAAAVNLGLFPVDGGPAYAGQQIAQAPVVSAPMAVETVPAPQPTARPAAVAALASPDTRASLRSASAPAPALTAAYAGEPKFWLQLASGNDREAFKRQFHKMKTGHRRMFDGIQGYVAQNGERMRLLIGPFRNASDADTFASDLESVRVNTFKWRNSDSDLITPLGS